MPPIKVLVVDDSALMRRLITRFLEGDGSFRVVDVAVNGEEALKKIKTLRPDVVTLDVEMPVMDGLTTLSNIMRQFPTPVVMLSAHTYEGARETMRALSLGAVDFVSKPTKPGEMESMAADLKFKLRAAAQASLRKVPVRTITPAIRTTPAAAAPFASHRPSGGKVELLVIGSSTGGPAALQQLIPALPATLSAGVVIVQHIPKGFSGPMSEHLDRKSKLKVKHADHGDKIKPGLVLVAPAGYDLTFRGKPGSLSVNLDAGKGPVPPGGFRPSVDVMMISAAETCGDRCMGVLLTGMGRDGARGMADIRGRRGHTIAEAESTCVVYGMPKAAVDLGAAEKVLPLHDIAQEIVRMV
jgi:two-component system chemotaxis response regulator CheB